MPRSVHTPGPWKTDCTDADGFSFVGSREALVAIVQYELFGSPSQAVAMANARLIAAAPDLLEACRRLEDQFAAYAANWRGDENGWVDRIGLPQDREFARAAITKAEGRA